MTAKKPEKKQNKNRSDDADSRDKSGKESPPIKVKRPPALKYRTRNKDDD